MAYGIVLTFRRLQYDWPDISEQQSLYGAPLLVYSTWVVKGCWNERVVPMGLYGGPRNFAGRPRGPLLGTAEECVVIRTDLGGIAARPAWLFNQSEPMPLPECVLIRIHFSRLYHVVST